MLAEAFNTVPDLVAVLVFSMKTDSNQQNWSFVLSSNVVSYSEAIKHGLCNYHHFLVNKNDHSKLLQMLLKQNYRKNLSMLM